MAAPTEAILDTPQGELRLAGRLGAVVCAGGAAGGALYWIVEPDRIASPLVGGLAILAALVFGLMCVVVPWERLSQPWIQLPNVVGAALVALAVANTGGSTSVFAIFFLYPAVSGAYFGTRRQTYALLAVVVVLSGLPVLYDTAEPAADRLLRWLFIASLASAIAVLVHRQREHIRRVAAHARTLALHDPLTGVPNRRGFDERAAAELARARRRRFPLALLAVDLDGFKAVNDAAGHGAGDDLLRRVALGAAAAVRAEDFVARYGGDEFVVLLPEADLADARRVAGRVVGAIERIGAEAPVSDGLSASVGMAAFPRDGGTTAELMRAADGDLRRIKRERAADRVRPLRSLALPAAEVDLPLPEELPARAADPPARVAPGTWPLGEAARGAVALAAGFAAAWFLAPLSGAGEAVRTGELVVVWAAALVALVAAARRASGRERVGWWVMVAGSLIGLVPVAGLVGAAAIGAGILVAAGLPRPADWRIAIDAADVLVLLATVAVALAVPWILDDDTLTQAETVYRLASVAVTVVGLACALLVVYRTSARARPDLWLVAGGFTAGAIAALPYEAALERSGGLPTAGWVVVIPLVGVAVLTGAWLRALGPACPPASDPRAASPAAPFVGNVLLAGLLVALVAVDGAVPAFVVPFLLVTLALRHVRARLSARETTRLGELAQRGERDAAVQYRASLVALSRALEARDGYTGAHGVQTVALARRVARRLGLPATQVTEVETVALLHDTGKIGMPDEVLRKPGPLGGEEWSVVREHPIVGERILRGVPGLERVARAVRHEHEHWDGGGYPDGLAGEAIPLASRIVLVCDAFHAMTSDRPYRTAMPRSDAVEELQRGAGEEFDPAVVRALLQEVGDAPGSGEERGPERRERGDRRGDREPAAPSSAPAAPVGPGHQASS